jgi:hypothetical protein
MTGKRKILVLIILLAFFTGENIYTQEFGFGLDETGNETTSITEKQFLRVKLGGSLETAFLGYVYDFKSLDKLKIAALGEIITGKVNLSAAGANADAYIGLNLSIKSLYDLGQIYSNTRANTPLIFDEVYLSAFFGQLNIEAGYRKLFWGKADNMGPLDIINPMNFSDLTGIGDIKAMKIARPLLHAVINTSGFSKLEAVFIPNFQGDLFAQDGKWKPSQFSNISMNTETGIFMKLKNHSMYSLMTSILGSNFDSLTANVRNNMESHFSNSPIIFPATDGLEFFQTGIRYSAAFNSFDTGCQYYYGFLPRPSITIDGIDAFLDDLISKNIPPAASYGDPKLLSAVIKYSRFHQIGIDYGRVIFNFNIRAEFAAFITEDLSGNDGTIKNPFLAWSFGFDRDFFKGFNLNIQCNETIRLLSSGIDANPALDFEADTAGTATRFTIIACKKFLNDKLENKITVIWNVENSDCYIIPGIFWTIKDVKAELSAGILAGKEDGELGQYWENSFIKLGLKYTF